jgi:hypothetical protein
MRIIEKLLNLFRCKVYLVKYPDPMSQDECRKILAEQGENSRLWQALDTIIDFELLDAINEVSDNELTTNKLSHASGRVEAISNLKAKIEEAKKWRSGKMNYKTN